MTSVQRYAREIVAVLDQMLAEDGDCRRYTRRRVIRTRASKRADQNNFQIAAAMPAHSSKLIMMALTHGHGDEYLRLGANLAPVS
jgi:hypothetical protein